MEVRAPQHLGAYATEDQFFFCELVTSIIKYDDQDYNELQDPFILPGIPFLKFHENMEARSAALQHTLVLPNKNPVSQGVRHLIRFSPNTRFVVCFLCQVMDQV
jgi:hypothetical protein